MDISTHPIYSRKVDTDMALDSTSGLDVTTVLVAVWAT